MAKGRKILIDGPDGAGKSTQAVRVCAFLESIDIKAVVMHEPTDVGFGKMIRMILNVDTGPEDLKEAADGWFKDRMEKFLVARADSPFFGKIRQMAGEIMATLDEGKRPQGLYMQFLYLADRYYDVIAADEHVRQGTWVVFDRFRTTSPAYGYGQHGVPVEDTFKLESEVLAGIDLSVQVILYLDLSAEACLSRMKASGKKIDIFETLPGIRKTIDGYRQVLSTVEEMGESVYVVDASKSEDSVFDSVMDGIRKSFKMNLEASPV